MALGTKESTAVGEGEGQVSGWYGSPMYTVLVYWNISVICIITMYTMKVCVVHYTMCTDTTVLIIYNIQVLYVLSGDFKLDLI